jgi:hypothetical protein
MARKPAGHVMADPAVYGGKYPLWRKKDFMADLACYGGFGVLWQSLTAKYL